MVSYDYETYFSKRKKIDYWKAKRVFDEKYLLPLVNSDKYTLNAGSGLFVEKDLLKIKRTVCADISETAVKKLKKSGVTAVKADLKEKWSFKNEEFEQVLMLDIFEHLGHVENYLNELHRVTKKAGQ